MSGRAAPGAHDWERAARLARAGAQRAALALGMLVRGELRASDPCPVRDALPSSGDLTGVLFEMEGALGGLVALLLPADLRGELLSSMCHGQEQPQEVLVSALREAGNIVASQAVSGVADTLGARISITVPTLVWEDAGKLVDGLLAGRARSAAVCVFLRDVDCEESALLVFAPDDPAGL